MSNRNSHVYTRTSPPQRVTEEDTGSVWVTRAPVMGHSSHFYSAMFGGNGMHGGAMPNPETGGGLQMVGKRRVGSGSTASGYGNRNNGRQQVQR